MWRRCIQRRDFLRREIMICDINRYAACGEIFDIHPQCPSRADAQYNEALRVRDIK